jgi:acyl-CoA oxidase
MPSSASPAPPSLSWPEDRPVLLPVLPLIHVAWADGVLTEGERSVFRELILDAPPLEAGDRAALAPWLDPETPPSPAALVALRSAIRERATPEAADAASLTELGVHIARAEEGHRPWRNPAARHALAAAEASLGVLGREAVRSLLAWERTEGDGPRPALFDAARMGAVLAHPFPDVRERTLALMREPAFETPVEIDRAAHRDRVLAAVRRIADEGLGAVGFPERYGGGGSPGGAIAVFETLGFGDLSILVKYGVQFGLFGGAIYQLGSERHHERYLGPIMRLELPGCYAMTEIGHGSNVREIETVARFDPARDGFVIHTPHEAAGKEWIGNAALHGRTAVVFAQLEVAGQAHGVHAFVVPIRDEEGSPCPGVRIADNGPKVGLDGVDNGRLWFDGVHVPRDHLLDRFAAVDDEGRYTSPIPSAGRRFFTMLGTLVGGRISIAAAAVSVAKTALTIGVRYSARRRQFGPEGGDEVPVLDFTMQRRLLLPRLAATYGLHFAVRDLVGRYDRLLVERWTDEAAREHEARELEVRAAGLKALSSWHALETVQAARESMGGRGYHAANRLGRLRADVDIFTTFEGANVVLLQLVAKGLLTRFREEMGDLRLWDALKYVAERAQHRVAKLNPVVVRRTDEDHLRDPHVHAAAFRYREDRLLASAARRLKDRMDDGVDSFAALNQVQDHLVTLAQAHVERLVLEALQTAVTRAPSPGISETLRTLGGLYALERMERHRGWFLEAGYLEPPKSRAIRTQVNRLVDEVAEHAELLVDAFGIPDDILRAPDARGQRIPY